MNTEEFIKKATEKFGDKFNYGKVNTKVTIICSEHGEFNQNPNIHLTGNGCPKCDF